MAKQDRNRLSKLLMVMWKSRKRSTNVSSNYWNFCISMNDQFRVSRVCVSTDIGASVKVTTAVPQAELKKE